MEITHEVRNKGNKGMKSGRLYKTKQEQIEEGISFLISILAILKGKAGVSLSSVQEWLVGCFWSFLCVYTIN